MSGQEIGELSAEKERLFAAFRRGEIDFDSMSQAVHTIDYPPRRARTVVKLLVAAVLPLLFIHSQRNSDA